MPRINVTISEKLRDYFAEKSKETGATQSSLIAMALGEYVEQKKVINDIAELADYIKNNSGFDSKNVEKE